MTIGKLGLTAKALQLATERPRLWEYSLFAQVIIDEVETVKGLFQRGHRAHGVRVDQIATIPNSKITIAKHAFTDNGVSRDQEKTRPKNP